MVRNTESRHQKQAPASVATCSPGPMDGMGAESWSFIEARRRKNEPPETRKANKSKGVFRFMGDIRETGYERKQARTRRRGELLTSFGGEILEERQIFQRFVAMRTAHVLRRTQADTYGGGPPVAEQGAATMPVETHTPETLG